MSLKRRLAAAGMPAAGVTIFAVLALTGQPASAASVDSAAHARAVTAVEPTASPTDGRGGAGYGDYTGGAGPTATATATATSTSTRGNGGYGGVTPTTAPTPTGDVDTVPPGGVSPTTPGGGAGPDSVPGTGGGTLPLTGVPMVAITTLGGLLVALGVIAVWYTGRRRRSV
jgi:hypothetical protein